ncbi:hypothetical protein KI387_010647 [Taxus chinensis]|uniref:Uncharacterized protein n=1 Tax=Taxus chinensis TaxID=29808 RepID=A0AA38KFR1_TAXCH|nr:hypothetical protein KI387_010647 [Taxus chinensis]
MTVTIEDVWWIMCMPMMGTLIEYSLDAGLIRATCSALFSMDDIPHDEMTIVLHECISNPTLHRGPLYIMVLISGFLFTDKTGTSFSRGLLSLVHGIYSGPFRIFDPEEPSYMAWIATGGDVRGHLGTTTNYATWYATVLPRHLTIPKAACVAGICPPVEVWHRAKHRARAVALGPNAEDLFDGIPHDGQGAPQAQGSRPQGLV